MKKAQRETRRHNAPAVRARLARRVKFHWQSGEGSVHAGRSELLLMLNADNCS